MVGRVFRSSEKDELEVGGNCNYLVKRLWKFVVGSGNVCKMSERFEEVFKN